MRYLLCDRNLNVPNVFLQKTRGQCRLILKDVTLSNCCVSDVPRFDTQPHFNPYSIKGSPFNAVVLSIHAPRKEGGYGLSTNDIQEISTSIKDVLHSPPYNIRKQ